MEFSRRDFLKLASASAAAIGLSSLELSKAERVLAASTKPAVIWLSGAGCTGCSISLLNATNSTIDQVLTSTISLKYHPTLMAASGDLAVAAARSTAQAGGYILVVEDAIPTAFGGRTCYVWDEGGVPVTMAAAVSSLAAKAKAIVAVGSCASFGGVSAANPATGQRSVQAYLNRPTVNIPGCPAHPDWIIGSLVQLIGGTTPSLDSYRRPTAYFGGEVIHENCPRQERSKATAFAQNGLCLRNLGCKGPVTHGDCESRKWNNAQNWCIGANGLCIGCTEPSFPSFPLHSVVSGGD